MTYRAALTYLNSFINYEQKTAFIYRQSFKVERIRDFLRMLGNPQESLCCLHVAGTKGKGSTCAFAAYLLRESGYRVGLYTSPHLSVVRERIRILEPRHKAGSSGSGKGDFEGMISAPALTRLVACLQPRIDRFSRACPLGPLSFFEVYTALALEYFRQQQVDFAVLETGMGGRLDATNVVIPVACAITPISYDHTNKLGSTLAEIAGEKAGIIKPSVPVICAPQPPEALQEIRRACRRHRAELFEIGRDIRIVPDSRRRRRFSLEGRLGSFPGLAEPLPGSHQVINAAIAVSLVAAVCRQGVAATTRAAVRTGLRQTVWPGRCEIVGRDPLMLLDGAHNRASARVLRETVEEEFAARPIILVLGISQDKDVRGICRELIPHCRTVILTRADNPRSLSPEAIVGRSREFLAAAQVTLTSGVRQALQEAASQAARYRRPLILVTGSLFVVGEARRIVCNRPGRAEVQNGKR